jgi:multidrug efflux pump
MSLIEVFIKKPVISIAICLIIVMVGIAALVLLPRGQLPKLPANQITISTSYYGASPETLQGFVTEPIESALLGMEGIDYITGTNLPSSSTISVYLNNGEDITAALTEINARVSSTMWRLPANINTPIVNEVIPSSPALFLSLTSKTEPLNLITAYADHIVIPAIEAIPGVSDVRVRGVREYAMRIRLNPLLEDAYGITADEIVHSISQQHLQAAIGAFYSKNGDFTFGINSSLETTSQFNNLIVKEDSHKIIKLSTVATAVLGAASITESVFEDGQPGVLLYMAPQPGANVLTQVHQILQQLPLIDKKLPPGMKLNVLWNPTKFTEKSIESVSETLWEVVALIILIICLFVGEFKAALIPVATIVLCLLGTCAIMYLLDFSINTMTILAAVLALGLVVDDAIVVVENVHRHILLGAKSAKQAALESVHEITLVIIAMTLVVAIFFVPIAMLTGVTGVLFREFAITMSIMVVFSGFITLVVSPMMCAYCLKDKETRYAHKINIIFNKVAFGYQYLLECVLKFRYLMLLLLVLLFGLCYAVFTQMNSELLPNESQGVLLAMAEAPSSANSVYVVEEAKKLMAILKTIPEVQHYGVIAGDHAPYNNYVAFLVLRPHQKGDRSEDQIKYYLDDRVKSIPGMRIAIFNRPLLADVAGLAEPVSFALQSTGSYDQLAKVAAKFIATIKENRNLRDVSSSLHLDKPGYDIKVNRKKAVSMGVSMSQISSTLNALFGRPKIGWFSVSGFSYPIIPAVQFEKFTSPMDLNTVDVRTSNGKLVSLSTVAQYHSKVGPTDLIDFQGLHTAIISASLNDGYTLGQALNYLESTADHVLPSNMKYDFAGQSRIFVESSDMMVYIFIGCLLAVYLLLVIKFNCFRDPLIILIAVPLSALGGLMTLYFKGYTLNIYTEIGLMMLMGLISKHGILIVNFANKFQIEGSSLYKAIVRASLMRLKPILMITLAMVFGSIPLILATGAGYENLQQIGYVLLGGVIFGSLMTLFMVPTVYLFLGKRIYHASEPI